MIFLFSFLSLSLVCFFFQYLDCNYLFMFQIWKCITLIVKGINALMFISDGSSPSIFRRNLRRTRPMVEEMGEKVFVSRRSREFQPLM